MDLRRGQRRERRVVVRTFDWLNRSRRLSKDCERTTASSEAFVKLAKTCLMLRWLRGVRPAEGCPMSGRRAAKPSVLGCAFGFGTAGSGVGVTLGMLWFVAVMQNMAPEQRKQLRGTASYAYIAPGMYAGTALGAVAGIAYALRRRRPPTGT